MVNPARRAVLDGRGMIAQPDGITRYTIELVREIARQARNMELFLLVREGLELDRFVQWRDNLKCIPVPFSHIGPGTLARVGAIVDRMNPDLYHSFFMLQPLRMKTPGIISVHDTLWFQRPWLQMPESGIRRLAGWLYYRLAVGLSVRKSRRIIVVSDATRRDLCGCWPQICDKVRVIGEGADHRFADPVPFAEAAERLRRYGVKPDGFFLHPSNGKPYKNTPLLLRAYADAAQKQPLPPLAVIGRESAFSGDIAQQVLTLNRQGRADVRMLGSVPDEDVPLLFQNAQALLFPSRYEGFGLPVLEAMQAGTPVLTSRISALPEVAGNAALLVSPDSVAEMAGAILSLAGNPDLRYQLAEKGRKQAARFSWEEAAASVLQLYREVFTGDG